MNGKRITLLISGSIAAYKSAEIARECIKRGATVQVAMTESATKFITPLTLQTLTGNPVMVDMFDPQQESEIGHIALADKADVILVAPATANIIAKTAHGMSDSVVAAVLLATKSPIVMAPAMNVNMWENPITQSNVKLLKEHGMRFIEPEEGELACGWFGSGRLAETETIVSSIADLLGQKTASNSPSTTVN